MIKKIFVFLSFLLILSCSSNQEPINTLKMGDLFTFNSIQINKNKFSFQTKNTIYLNNNMVVPPNTTISGVFKGDSPNMMIGEIRQVNNIDITPSNVVFVSSNGYAYPASLSNGCFLVDATNISVANVTVAMPNFVNKKFSTNNAFIKVIKVKQSIYQTSIIVKPDFNNFALPTITTNNKVVNFNILLESEGFNYLIDSTDKNYTFIYNKRSFDVKIQ